jgi:hypothetical protein
MTIATVAHRHLTDLASEAIRWDGAACIGHGHLFFLDEFTGTTAVADTAEAKRICVEECPLLQRCRDWAIAQRIPHGVDAVAAGGLQPPLVQRLAVHLRARTHLRPHPSHQGGHR